MRAPGTQQSANACKVSGWAVTSFKSSLNLRVSMPRCSLINAPTSYRHHQLWYTLLNVDCKRHLVYAAQSNDGASKFGEGEGSDPPPNSRHHPKRQKVTPLKTLLFSHGGRVHGTKGELDFPDQPQVHLELPGE